MAKDWISENDDTIILKIYVQPAAAKNAISGEHDGHLKIQIQAPPEKGAANRKLISHLAKILELPKSSLQLIAGHTSRNKKVAISLDQINNYVNNEASKLEDIINLLENEFKS